MNRAKDSKISVWLRIAQSFLLVLLVVFLIISFVDPSSAAVTGAGETEFNDLMLGIQATVGGVIGLLAIVMVIAGGIVYAASGGDSGQIKLGKEIIMSAIAGLLLFMFTIWFLGANLGPDEGIISRFFPPTS